MYFYKASKELFIIPLLFLLCDKIEHNNSFLHIFCNIRKFCIVNIQRPQQRILYHMIIHIPHASLHIDKRFEDVFTLSTTELDAEKLRMVDLYTDELFAFVSKRSTTVEFHHCRLLVDVERFVDDHQELMSKVGMGVIYKKTASGDSLKRTLTHIERQQLLELYHTHHQHLSAETTDELERAGIAVIVDGHSFPSSPLPCDQDQTQTRPDFCLGFDEYHSKPALIAKLTSVIEDAGYSLGLNTPYAGSLVPMDYYQKESKVLSIMIEINRRIYMNESTGEKLSEYQSIKEVAQKLLKTIETYQYSL